MPWRCPPLILGGAGLASAKPTDTASTQPNDRGSVQQSTGEPEWNHTGGTGQWDHGWKHNSDHRGNIYTGDDKGDYHHHGGDDGLLGNLLGL